ncbi:hypothetical protein ASPWEDRAFT_707438 [Aspergillus wentii DTO 134E9]|uniref:Uncharacterized protein n=1 Tax=Aspergillus wentii DTO 134E9 TaxID=1073089 RepID=A0A1L9R622_ASPWE|nr:uncharacterized protein ASPWEDRAFT_707438 [Aspergillus wentii DTO 134E9]OJJ30360.1 hypothetical protein ASPWEDRAFT_707438 [Aspergillus wentii DTO 134E9]
MANNRAFGRPILIPSDFSLVVSCRRDLGRHWATSWISHAVHILASGVCITIEGSWVNFCPARNFLPAFL